MEGGFYKAFNDRVDEFFKDVIEGFPKTVEFQNVISEFKTLKSGFAFLKTADPKKPQQVFRDYVLSTYRDKIVNRDESFFICKDDFDISSSRKEYWMDFIGKIKLAWSSMDDNNKDIIWKYFKLLVLISDKCDNKTT